MFNKIILSLIVLISGANLKAQIMDTTSYSVGVILAENLKQQGLKDLNMDVIAEAMKDFTAGDSKMDTPTAEAYFSAAIQKAQEAQHEVVIEEGKVFLAENAKKEGVVTTDSGLQYKILKPGNGPKPSLTDKVKVHYHGTLMDGQVFDSSVERGEPISFPLNGVITGWQEGLQLMPVGSKYLLYIPYDLAYGNRGAGQLIKPYSTLVFEVELLGIE